MSNGGNLFNLSIGDLKESTENLIQLDDEKLTPSDAQLIKTEDKVDGKEKGEKEDTKEKTEDKDKLIEVETVKDEKSVQRKEELPGSGSPEKEDKEDDSSPLITPFAKALYEQGVLPHLDVEKFDGTVDGLFNAIDTEIKVHVDAYKESLPSEIKDLIDNYEEGVPLDKIIESKSRKVEYTKVSDESISGDESLQKKLVRDFLKEKGWTSEKIEAKIQRYEDSGVLEDEAKDALSYLKESEDKKLEELKEQNKKQTEEAKRRNQEMISSVKKTIEDTQEIVPGLTLNKTSREKIFKSMTEVTSYDEKGSPLNKVMEVRAKDPIKFEIILHYLTNLGVFEGDWSKIKSVTKTNAVKELEEKLNSNSGFKTGKPGVSEKSTGLIESLKMFRK